MNYLYTGRVCVFQGLGVMGVEGSEHGSGLHNDGTQEWGWKRERCMKCYDLNRKEQGWGLMKSGVRLQSNSMFDGVGEMNAQMPQALGLVKIH